VAVVSSANKEFAPPSTISASSHNLRRNSFFIIFDFLKVYNNVDDCNQYSFFWTFNSFAEPRQPSLLSLTCMFEHLFSINHSLQKRKERLIHAAKLLNINKSAKQNNKFFHIALADICC